MFWLLLSLGVLLIIFLVTLVFFCVHSGLLHDVDVSAGKPPLGSLSDADQPHVIAYKFDRGRYRDAGHLFTEICSLLPRPAITLGLYFDDPEKVAERDCRYAVGVILGVGSSVDTLPAEQRALLSDLEKRGYRSFILPPITSCLHSWFPFTTTVSVILAINRVYPALHAEVKEKRLNAGPAIEIYTTDRIYFLMPLENNSAFFVPECGPCDNTAETSPVAASEQPLTPPLVPFDPLVPEDANNNESSSNNNEQLSISKSSQQEEFTAEAAPLSDASCSKGAAQLMSNVDAVDDVCSTAAPALLSAPARTAADGEESDASGAEGGSRVGDETETETTDADSSNATTSSFENVDRDEDSSARASPTRSPPSEAAGEGD